MIQQYWYQEILFKAEVFRDQGEFEYEDYYTWNGNGYGDGDYDTTEHYIGDGRGNGGELDEIFYY